VLFAFTAALSAFPLTAAVLPRGVTIPFSFEARPADGSYIAHAPGAGLLLSRRGVQLQFQNGKRQGTLGIRFEGANRSFTLKAADPLPGRANYFMGPDPAQWRTNVQQFGRVVYQGVYPGIDVQFRGDPRHLEYDWMLAPGADPRSIGLAFEGVQSIRVDDAGELVLVTATSEIRQQKPAIFQDGQQINGRFVVRGPKVAGFEVNSYDKTRPLIIDPILTYSTFLGGQDGDAIYTAFEDAQGNLIVGGATLSPNFPTRNAVVASASGGNVQGFIAKMNPTATGGGSVIWSTYLGSADNFSWVLGVSADTQGNVLATGTTAATGFPLVSPFQKILNSVAGSSGCPNTPFDLNSRQNCVDAFAVKLTSAGDRIVYSTYLGGDSNDVGYAIAADPAGNAYVTGQTSSFDFPAPGSPLQTTLRGPTDGFLSRFGPDGTLNYSTYFGGDGDEVVTAMALTPKGSAYLAGTTSSGAFPLVTPFQNVRPAPVVGFLARIDLITGGPGTLGYSSYLGGVSGSASITSMALGPDGNVYLAGGTSASDFPITPATALKPQYSFAAISNAPLFDIPSFLVPTFGGNLVTGDAFVTELNPAAISSAQLIYSTFLGGIYNDAATGVALDAAGRIVLSGVTTSYDFPVTGDALIQSNGSATVVPTVKAFMTIIDPTVNKSSGLAYSTYLGGSANDFAAKVVADATSAIVVGQTRSRNFPVVAPYQPLFGGQMTPGLIQGDGFISRFDLTQNSPIVSSALNGASFHLGSGFAPGEIVTFFGQRLGPAQIVLAQLGSNGRLATQLGTCQVLVDGNAAPLVHSVATQITAILPYELSAKIGQTVNAQVACGSLKSNLFPLPIVDSDPGIFSVSGGTGQAAVLNQDGTYNSAANAAVRGTIVQIFATGEGVLTPPGVDGQIETGPLSSIPKPAMNVRVTFAGVASFDIPYTGVAPGEVDGLLQINVRVPSDAPTGNVELLLQVGAQTSPSKLTIALK
jgi:uncharacterized protein (TIGR03437 family)